jgi:HxlR-like helix-turn-helix protein
LGGANKQRKLVLTPLNASVEMLGDRWSLLIIRDMMLQGARTYKTFLECYEGIATNILADRLRKLAAYGIITHLERGFGPAFFRTIFTYIVQYLLAIRKLNVNTVRK